MVVSDGMKNWRGRFTPKATVPVTPKSWSTRARPFGRRCLSRPPPTSSPNDA